MESGNIQVLNSIFSTINPIIARIWAYTTTYAIMHILSVIGAYDSKSILVTIRQLFFNLHVHTTAITIKLR